MANTTQAQLTACTQQTLAGTETQTLAFDSHISRAENPLGMQGRTHSRQERSVIPSRERQDCQSLGQGWQWDSSRWHPATGVLFLGARSRDRDRARARGQPCLAAAALPMHPPACTGLGKHPWWETAPNPRKNTQGSSGTREGGRWLFVSVRRAPINHTDSPEELTQVLFGAPAGCWNLVPFKVPANQNQSVIPRLWSIL